MPGSRKRPSIKRGPGRPRKPKLRSGEPVRSTNRSPVSFAFPYEVRGFGFPDCDRNELLDLFDAFRLRSRMTWAEMISAPRTGLGTETIARDAVRSVPPDITEDVNLLVLRTGRRGRVVGYRRDSVFVVVWVDPKHRLYGG